MPESHETNDNLAPLDLVRKAEADVTRLLAAAQEAAEQAVKEAQAKAAKVRRQALEAGRREGAEKYKEIIAQAEQEAEAILAQARNQADELQRRGREQMEAAVDHVVSVVLGTERSAEEA